MSVLISIAAIIVPLVVAVVQYAQWRTANQKVVVDLFDRRRKVFDRLSEGITPVMREGEVSGPAFTLFMIGQADARFLFGDDVQDYLEKLRHCFVWLTSMTNEVIDTSPKRAEMIDTKHKHIAEIISFYEKAPTLFAPYMRLTQKTLRSGSRGNQTIEPRQKTLQPAMLDRWCDPDRQMSAEKPLRTGKIRQSVPIEVRAACDSNSEREHITYQSQQASLHDAKGERRASPPDCELE
jgi:hypothetical protein